jgi:HEAT repeat protein
MLETLDFSEKSVANVCLLLDSPEREVRTAAAISLGYRYHHGVAINPPSWKTQHPEFPLPPQLIPNLARHLQSDCDNSVRIASLNALAELNHWTNTMPFIVIGLTNEHEVVRVHTCNTLVFVSRESSEPLAAGVLPTLAALLESEAGNAEVWYVAWTAGFLGRAGEPLVPPLQKLTEHKSSKVRRYAREALSSIQPKKRKGT